MGDAATVFNIVRTFNAPSFDGDDYRTFDNGIDLFGHKDAEIDAIRERHGEDFRGFRLLLMRKTKNSPVVMKLWISYTLDSPKDTVPWLCALSAGLAAAEYRTGDFHQVYIDAHLVDWRPTGGEPALEYSFEVLSDWRNRLDVLDVAKAFDKAANKKMKEYKV